MPANPIKLHSLIILLVTAVVFTGIYSSIFDKKLDLNGDNAHYYILGKALATGEGYVNINTIQKQPNNHFPPGYPIIISGIIKVFGDSIISIKIANGVLLLFTLIALYFLVKQISKRESTAIIVLVLVLLNSHLLRYSTIMMTEISFLFFSTITILAFTKVNYNKPLWQDVYLYLVIYHDDDILLYSHKRDSISGRYYIIPANNQALETRSCYYSGLNPIGFPLAIT